MLDQMKLIGALGKLMKDRDQLEAKAKEVKAKLEDMRIDGEAGGGAARATVTGAMKVIEVKLDPALASGMGSGDEAKHQAERLITEAVNDAMRNAQQAAREEVRKAAQEAGLPDIPGMDKLLAGG